MEKQLSVKALALTNSRKMNPKLSRVLAMEVADRKQMICNTRTCIACYRCCNKTLTMLHEPVVIPCVIRLGC